MNFESNYVENEQMPDQGDQITALIVEPFKEPRITKISTDLSALQKAVGGYIEVVYPFSDPVAVIANEEGKLEGLPLNRGLYDEDGQLYDVIAGTFLVTGLTDDSFGSLTEEQIAKFTEIFRTPQIFAQMGDRLVPIPTPEGSKEKADMLAGHMADLLRDTGLDSFYGIPESAYRAKTAQLSTLLRTGNDFSIRRTLLALAKTNTEYSKECLAMVKTMDAFYQEMQIPRFSLYQIDRDNADARKLSFLSYGELNSQGKPLDGRNYSCVYSGLLPPGETLDSIYERFNLRHPADFRGHSLSVSDVVVLHQNGQDQAFYVDAFGFRQVPEFFAHNPLEKVEELLEDDYGMIDGIINNGDRKKEQEPEKKPSVLEKLQEKKTEAERQHQDAVKLPKSRDCDHDLS